ncbi:hypothetical protein [Dactylosporangium sp. CA-139066]|uniref:hypothetical protein n=1 Tax=Dactylosporangium sp. CA-139066 TaxID=3239930 RepID=UPI003D929318
MSFAARQASASSRAARRPRDGDSPDGSFETRHGSGTPDSPGVAGRSPRPDGP